jgi:hypothetical protein
VKLQPTTTDRTPITGELTMTYAEYRRIVLAPRATSLWMLRLLGTITLLWLAQMVAMGAASGGILLPIVLSLALLVGHEVVALLEWQRYRTLAALGPFRYEVTSSGLRVTTAQIDLTVAWSGISRVRGYRPCWVFWVSVGDRPLPVSRAAFSAESQAAVDEVLRHLTR